MQGGRRLALWIGALAVLGWLAYRAWWITTLPVAYATDPHIRMFHRDELVLDFLGRNWLPLLQVFVVWIYDAGGALDEVQIFTSVSSSAFILLAAVYLWRVAGPVAALLFAVLLAVNEDIMWISASPFQEALFYSFALAVLLVLRGVHEDRGIWWPVALCAPFLALSLLCRYEGLMLSTAAAISISRWWWRDRSVRSALPYAGLAVLYVALPAVGLIWFNADSDPIARSFVTNLLVTTRSMALFLGNPYVLVWLALVAIRFALIPWKPRTWSLDELATALFLGFFVAVFVVWNPFVPPQNSRFHVPLLLAIFGAGSAAVPILYGRLVSAVDPSRVVALTAVLVALFAAHAGREWRDTVTIMNDRAKNKITDATIGRVADRSVPPPKDLLLLWDRAVINGHPSGSNMRVGSFLRGREDRIRFLADYTALEPEARTAWVRESAGGYLIEDKRSPQDTVEDLLRRTARIHGEDVRVIELPRGTTLVMWGEPPAGSTDPARPSATVQIGDLLR